MKYENVISARCRTCLKHNTDMIPIDVNISLENHGECMTIMELINKCAAVEILKGDSKPQAICKLCMENAQITYNFRKTCKDSECILLLEQTKQWPAKDEFISTVDDHFSSDDEIPLSTVASNVEIINASKTSIIETHEAKDRYMIATDRKEQECQLCYKLFANNKLLLAHNRCHKGSSPKLPRNIQLKKYEKKYKSNKKENLGKKRNKGFCLPQNDETETNKSGMTFSENASNNNSASEYICPICNRAFIMQKSFIFHLKRHEDVKWKHKFAETNTTSNTEDTKINLLEVVGITGGSETSPIDNLCPICNKTFSMAKYLQRHLRRHQASGRLSIRNFNKKLNHQVVMNDQIVTPPKRVRVNIGHQQEFSCNLCSTSFPKRTLLRDHLQSQHNISKVPSKCCYCEWTGESADLAKHKEEHSQFKNFKCEYCVKKFFNKKSLQIHTLIHTGEKKHMCHYCGKSFAVKHNLKMHIRTHTGEKPYKCDLCEKTFAQKSEVTVHMITHTEDRNYVCSVCGVTCRRKGALRDHLRSHLPIEEWDKCPVCSKAFRTREQLKDHMHQHTGERNHVCNICGKDYGRRRNLRTHMKIHTGESPHVCLVCGRAFSQKHVLLSHMKTHDK